MQSPEEFSQHVWNNLFSEKLVTLAQSSDMLQDENGVRICDLVAKSMKLWTRHVCEHLWGLDPDTFSPSASFLDTETILRGNLTYAGKEIHLRGKPDAVFFDERRAQLHVRDNSSANKVRSNCR